jgi:vacuolar-type H+-ATPase subunit H
MNDSYEVHADIPIEEARVFRFEKITEAEEEAVRLCSKFNCEVRVLKLMGTVKPSVEWVEP